MEYTGFIETIGDGSGTDGTLTFVFCGTEGQSNEIGPFTNISSNSKTPFNFNTFEDIGDIARISCCIKLNGTDIRVGPFVVQVNKAESSDYYRFTFESYDIDSICDGYTENNCTRAVRSGKIRDHRDGDPREGPPDVNCPGWIKQH